MVLMFMFISISTFILMALLIAQINNTIMELADDVTNDFEQIIIILNATREELVRLNNKI